MGPECKVKILLRARHKWPNSPFISGANVRLKWSGGEYFCTFKAPNENLEQKQLLHCFNETEQSDYRGMQRTVPTLTVKENEDIKISKIKCKLFKELGISFHTGWIKTTFPKLPFPKHWSSSSNLRYTWAALSWPQQFSEYQGILPGSRVKSLLGREMGRASEV